MKTKINGIKSMLAASLLLCFAWSAHAQQRQLTISATRQPLAEVLKSIETQTGYSIFYNAASFDAAKLVSIKSSDEDVLAVLNRLFDGMGIQANLIDGGIVLSTENVQAAPKPQQSVSSKLQVSGTVVDKDGLPVIGAGIASSVDKAVVAVTDMDGKFNLSASKGDVLKINAMGYQESIISVSGKLAGLIITMAEDVQLLDEVIVVGYGVQKRSDITGAISSVNSEKAKGIPTVSVAEMLRGSAPGLQINIGSAEPGGTSSVLIRGRHSLSGDNAPLYIVDGVPMTSIDDVNANDISSIEVLKDASSQSIYGARAANGVILITTKRGSAGKTKVSYDGYVAVQTNNRNFHFYNGEQWAAYRHEAFFNAYGYYDRDECFRGVMGDVLESGNEINWEDIMIKPALQNSHNILVQAGTGKTKIAAGLGWYGQDGMVSPSSFEKVSGRLNIDQKLSENVNFGTNISYMRSWRTTADGSFSSFVTMPPLAVVYDAEGNLKEDVTEAGESHTNPLWNIMNSDNSTIQNRLIINAFLDWKIVKGVSYRLNASMSQRDVESHSYLGLKHTTGKNTQGSASTSTSNSADYLVENILNFNYDFTKDHHFDATLMQSINYITWKKIGYTATGFANDDLSYNAIGNALDYGKPSYELSERQLASFLARARYNYKGRYLFTLSTRVDGSSVFGQSHKWGVFPSAAFAWRVNNEPFMQSTKHWLSNLKFRASVGQVGNQGVTPYTTLGNANSYYYRFGNEVGIGYLPSTALYNPNLKWETSTTYNVGFDFGFLKDRINGSIEFYDTETSDLLVEKSINQVLGYTTQMVNLGRVQNSGIEFSLNSAVISTKDLAWNVNLSLAHNRNRIRKISGEKDANGNYVNDINNKWFIGYPVNVYYDYQFDGIWQNDDDIASSHMPTATPGSIKIADTNGDNTVDEKDRVIMQRDPYLIGSLGTSLSFYGFDLSADMNVSLGGTFYNSYLTTFGNGGDMTGKRNGIRRNYWTKYNPSNEAPAPNMTQAPAYISSLGYQDASYIRLRSVTLGYTFRPELISRLRLSSLRLYLSATNVWYYTKVLGYGPEQNPGSYPEPRTVLFGMKLSF